MRISEHAPGTVCWVDLAVPDVSQVTRFYVDLFGWEPRVSEEPEANGYTMCHLKDAAVAGIGPTMGPGQPPMWTVYVATDDVDATARAVEGNGGRVLTGPMDVMKQGRMGIFADPAGAVFGAWEPVTFAGMQRVGEAGALTWAEVVVRDGTAVPKFYSRVFGWEGRPTGTPEAPYLEFLLSGRSVAGLMQMTGNWPADTPAHWMPYFEVADCDATVAKARNAGARIVVPPRDIEPGRFAMIGDPGGAYFSVIRMNAEFPRG